MTKNSQAAQLEAIIDKVVLPLEEAGVDIISTGMVAKSVFDLIDPKTSSPELVQFTSTMHIKQAVRGRLAKRHDPVEVTEQKLSDGIDDLFGDSLQPYYPARREGERVYAVKEILTELEVEANCQRMEKAGHSLLDHARALRAWFATKKA